jgi:hypothetical protein
LFSLFATGVVDTGGKFTAGVVDILIAILNSPVLLTLVANFPLVSLILVVQLDLLISQRIFNKMRNDPIVISRGLVEV